MNKKIIAFASLILGIISFLLSFNLFFLFFWSHGVTSSYIYSLSEKIGGIAVSLDWVFSLVAIIAGFWGLKSEKRKIAKLGIALSVASLLGYLLFFFLLWARFGGI
jgi:hypothetical protein